MSSKTTSLSTLRHALNAASPTLVLLVIAPASIYLGNQKYFDYQSSLIVHLSLVHLSIVVLLYVLFRLTPTIASTLGSASAVLGVFIFAGFILAPSPVADLPFGGIQPFSVSPWWLLLDLAIVAGVVALLRFVPGKVLVNSGSMLCAGLAIAIPSLVMIETARIPQDIRAWDAQQRTYKTPDESKLNVYHIVMDGFDGALFMQLVDAYRLREAFDGFVFYADAYANYTSTALSFPSFMNAELYDDTMTDARGIELARSGRLINTLVEHGVRVSQYNAYYINNHQLAHQRLSSSTLEMQLYGKLRHLSQLLDLSVMLSAPSVLKPWTVAQRRGLFTQLLVTGGNHDADWSRNRPLISLHLLAQLLRDEPARAARNQFVSAHLFLPHGPTSLNGNCEYQPLRADSAVSWREQSACAVAKLADFAAALRRQGRFKDSLIVLHSDHGTRRRERPLVLVKYPGQDRAALAIAEHPVQLLDIAPTILSELGIDYTDLSGVPLKIDTPEARSKIEVWIARPSVR